MLWAEKVENILTSVGHKQRMKCDARRRRRAVKQETSRLPACSLFPEGILFHLAPCAMTSSDITYITWPPVFNQSPASPHAVWALLALLKRLLVNMWCHRLLSTFESQTHFGGGGCLETVNMWSDHLHTTWARLHLFRGTGLYASVGDFLISEAEEVFESY